MNSNSKDIPLIFCAIDTPDIDKALELSKKAVQAGCGIKLGLEFFNSHGPQGVRTIIEENNNPYVFLDLKYYDIPNTVAGAVRAACRLGVTYINLHASGGLEMMEAAAKARQEISLSTKILAVTILTSLDEQAIEEIGYQPDISQRVVQMALLAQKAGLDGVVCSSKEITAITKACGNDFVTMVPGIRPEGSSKDDQKRVMTPKQAVEQGATHLVIGRPITGSDNPAQTVRDIMESLR